MRIIILLFLITLSFLFPEICHGEDSKYCSEENYKKISILYQNRNPETAEIIFQVISCGGYISKESKRRQLMALIGGFMRKNPDLIDHLYSSANSVKNTDAAKIFLDGLWVCSNNECRKKLEERPFDLPVKDVNNLLTETPLDPYSIPIEDPATLDFLWGYLFGSGDPKIAERVYALLRDNWEELNTPESMDFNKRLVLSAARWSLVSIASQQKLVRNVLEKENSVVARELLKEVDNKK